MKRQSPEMMKLLNELSGDLSTEDMEEVQAEIYALMEKERPSAPVSHSKKRTKMTDFSGRGVPATHLAPQVEASPEHKAALTEAVRTSKRQSDEQRLAQQKTHGRNKQAARDFSDARRSAIFEGLSEDATEGLTQLATLLKRDRWVPENFGVWLWEDVNELLVAVADEIPDDLLDTLVSRADELINSVPEEQISAEQISKIRSDASKSAPVAEAPTGTASRKSRRNKDKVNVPETIAPSELDKAVPPIGGVEAPVVEAEAAVETPAVTASKKYRGNRRVVKEDEVAEAPEAPVVRSTRWSRRRNKPVVEEAATPATPATTAINLEGGTGRDPTTGDFQSAKREKAAKKKYAEDTAAIGYDQWEGTTEEEDDAWDAYVAANQKEVGRDKVLKEYGKTAGTATPTADSLKELMTLLGLGDDEDEEEDEDFIGSLSPTADYGFKPGLNFNAGKGKDNGMFNYKNYMK